MSRETTVDVTPHPAAPSPSRGERELAASPLPRAGRGAGGEGRTRIFSGIQPTGGLHLGNYVGAVQNWVRMQETHDCIICIVDLHALTIEYDPQTYQERVTGMAIDLLACGIDPARTILFVQSHVPEHAELQWLLATIAPLGALERMTQYKDKAEQHKDNLNLGLLAYPVLQAADILLYKAQAVPVGEDQVQHLELTREIVRKFNHRFGAVFPEPQTILTRARRLPGLDGLGKMSKSKGNTIEITESAEEIWAKLRPAMTDPARKRRSDPGNPNNCSIGLMHYAISSPEQQDYITWGCTTAGIGCIECKKILNENVNALLAPIRERRAELAGRPDDVRDVLREGAERASAIARQTMREVRSAMGLA
jgi:tryptophanyl-tRNA synthetase